MHHGLFFELIMELQRRFHYIGGTVALDIMELQNLVSTDHAGLKCESLRRKLHRNSLLVTFAFLIYGKDLCFDSNFD